MPAGESILTLVPSSEPADGHFSNVTIELRAGTGVVIYSPLNLLLRVFAHPSQPSTYMVEKEFGDLRGVRLLDELAGEWSLQGIKQIIKPNGASKGLWLAPSIVGNSLYGGEIPENDTLVTKFGTIRPVLDASDGSWGVNITMPKRSYEGMDSLQLREA